LFTHSFWYISIKHSTLKLDQHISDLLYRYDCVIVPDFGGFVANYQAAKINSRTNMFTPPGKQLSFNKNLSGNDGLLASHIVQQYGVNYDDALRSISDCVNEYQRELKSGKRVLIDKVGVLYQDENKNVLFEPVSTVNYLSDSFGLDKFHVSPTIEEEKIIPIEKNKIRRIHPGRVAAAIAIPFFFIGSAFLFQNRIDENYAQIQLSSLGFNSAEPVYSTRNEVRLNSTNIEENHSFDALVDEASKRSFAFVPDIESEENWFIVGGCFSEESNAKSFIKKLQKKGYPAKKIDHYKKLHAVAYKGFSKESDAREFLAQVKQDENVSAWLLKK